VFAAAPLLLALWSTVKGDDSLVPATLSVGLFSIAAGALISTRRHLRPLAGWVAAAGWLGGWIALCTGNQALIVGFSTVALAWWLRRTDATTGASLLLIGLGIVAWRWALLGHFEGGYGFGNLEITVAYLGNPGRYFNQAVLRIVLKLLAPLGAAVALIVATRSPDRASAIPAAIIFVLVARLAHLSLGIAAEPTSFYSTYRLVGELAYQAAMLAGTWAAWGLLSLHKHVQQDVTASP
jgi:hypothetical protein